MTRYYKFLDENNKGPYSRFDYTAYLPVNGKPGRWLPIVWRLKECERGYHVCGVGGAGNVARVGGKSGKGGARGARRTSDQDSRIGGIMTRWTKSQKKEWELWIDSHYTKEERRKEFLIKAARVLLWALLVVSIVILAMMIGG